MGVGEGVGALTTSETAVVVDDDMPSVARYVKVSTPEKVALAVYVKLPPSGPSGGEVSLVYTERPGIKLSGLTGVAVLVTEARGKVDETFFQKMLGPYATVEQVAVNGHAGYWISGSPHDVAFTDADGHFYSESLRLATNTLLVDDNGTIVRIEGDLTKAQALQIAASMS